ncbi:MAG: 16S rRNA (adenine(1518)-N(6)/adenine(1519)-N(6))-dimethyltransferase RsmA [Alphaproteobacteria bacterium]|jgi:16S rRNA (adenine1518-N6/adenine1519-N6)-dimethyltransferase|nr:16S rRNA (adenine(1518)-N(6)/adenine(1519)-N(6))-dimethyltransferase RsmA [Candidatus Jidaibacter sp.]
MFNDRYFRELPSTGELLAEYKIHANKKLGQNFLLDSNITDTIINYVGNVAGQNILEIGSGPGTLTRSILAANPKKLYVVEFDKRFVPILTRIQEISEGVMEIFVEDAVLFEEEKHCSTPITVIANLPYNIGTELVIKWIEKIDYFDNIVVMLQREVAQRLCAIHKTKSYGKLSIFAQSICDAHVILDVEPHHFTPPPKVNSSVVCLSKKASRPNKAFMDMLAKVTRIAFALRRKKVSTSLSSLISATILDSLGIDTNKRAEELSVLEYHRITQHLLG